MTNTQVVEFFTKNKQNIESDYLSIEGNSAVNFNGFVEGLIKTTKGLFNNLDNDTKINRILREHCDSYSLLTKGLIRFWLFNALNRDILNYNVLKYLETKDRKDYKTLAENKRFNKSPLSSSIIHERNKELFKKKYGLLKAESYLEKRKFLENFTDYCLEKYQLSLNDLSAHTRDINNIAYLFK